MKKKKLKKKYKNILKLIIIIITIIVVMLNLYKIKLCFKGYNLKEINLIKEKISKSDINYILKYSHINYIVDLLNNESFNVNKLNNYIEYINNIEIDYDINDAIYLVNNNINYPYSKKLITVVKDKYYISSLLDRYMNYEAEKYEDIVTYVNANRDNDYYTNTVKTDTTLGTSMLVNKYHYLDNTYTPDDLVKVSSSYAYEGNYCSQITLDAFLSMYNDAIKNDIQLIINSGYRAYETQEDLWNTRRSYYGIEKADEYAARAGYSEHQTGLALDIDIYNSSNKEYAYKWLSENSYKYGFILRYPEGKEDITGYSYEPWHYRYVGKDIAKYIYENNITFDEYYSYFIEYK